MNLIQTLPALSPKNTRIFEGMRDYGMVFEVAAIYDAGGPRFRALEWRDAFEMMGCGFPSEARAKQEMLDNCLARIESAMAEHLAIINPINND